jgi:hypothetical protein
MRRTGPLVALVASTFLAVGATASCFGDDNGGAASDAGADGTTSTCPTGSCDASTSDVLGVDVTFADTGANDGSPPSDGGVPPLDAAACTDAGTGMCLVFLATNQPNPSGTSIDSTFVYWVDEGLGGGVMKTLINGGPLITLATNQNGSNVTAIDSTSIYWTNEIAQTVMKAPLDGVPDGGSPTTIAAGLVNPFGIVVDANGVYFTNTNGGTIMSAPLTGTVDGGPGTILASNLVSPTFLAEDANNLYWTNLDGRVLAMPKSGLPDGGSPTVIAAGVPTPYGIAVDANNVYFTSNTPDGGVLMAPKGGVPEGDSPTVVAAGIGNVDSVAVAGAFVFFSTGANGTGTVSMAPLDGGAVTLLANGQTSPVSVQVDSTNVYWCNFAFGRVNELVRP